MSIDSAHIEPGGRKVLVVHLVSFSYSGTTWLNLMLGAHPEAFSVGEVKNIPRFGRGICSIHVDSCPFWSRFKWPSDENPYLQLARLTGKRIFIVNNSRKFLEHETHPGIERKFVHLMRDGRAATASWLRKNPGKSMWSAAKLWAHDVRRDERLLARASAGEVESLTYERLLADTPAHMRRLCAFLGIEFDPVVVEYWRATDRHYLGGNHGTILSMLRMNDGAASLPENSYTRKWDLDYYQKVNAAKFVDERWKKELTDWQLRVFGLLAGRTNRRYGYPPSLDRSAPPAGSPSA
jgi:hypothetical protein